MVDNFYIISGARGPLDNITIVKASDKQTAIIGFNTINCGTIPVSNVKVFTLNSRDEVDDFSKMDKEILSRACERFIYHNPLGGYWLRDLSQSDDRYEVLNLIVRSAGNLTRKTRLFYVGPEYSSSDMERLADYIGTRIRVNLDNIVYSRYNHTYGNGVMDFSEAAEESDDYEKTVMVFYAPDRELVRLARTAYDIAEKQRPVMYALNQKGELFLI